MSTLHNIYFENINIQPFSIQNTVQYFNVIFEQHDYYFRIIIQPFVDFVFLVSFVH